MDKIIKFTKSNNFKKEHIITNDLVIIELNKEEILFDKPIYIGFTILELSKLHMYQLHYDVIKKNFPKSDLMYMDTDSLIYDIYCDDVYNDLISINKYFDMSTYPDNYIFHNNDNKGKLGTLKDEYSSYNNKLNLITKFICLKSKCYSLLTLYDKNTKRCKGIVKNQVNNLTHSLYEDYMLNNNILKVKQTTFKTLNHMIYTIDTTKDCLSNKDNKRITDPQFPIYTYPHGYFKTNNNI